MKILICGGRTFGEIRKRKQDPDYLKRVKQHAWGLKELDNRFGDLKGITVICGMADGGDTIGYDWAESWAHPMDQYPPDWKVHGKSAGALRNIQMLEEGKPDLVVAFPGGNGTEHMCRIARKKGVDVLRLRYYE